MIRHGIKYGELKENEEDISEYLEVNRMTESMEKHKKLVILNPDNYQSWKFIRNNFLASIEEIKQGLDLTLKALQINPKSYCAWNSREFYLNYIKDELFMETKLCKILLHLDPRNFHCWNHCRKFNLEIPLDYTNYSSLHNKLYNLKSDTGRAIENLFTDVNNEASWAYFYKYDMKLVDFWIHLNEKYFKIYSNKPFSGKIIYKNQEFIVNIPLLVYKIKMAGIIEKFIIINGNKYEINKKKEPFEINEILKLQSECIYALREKLKYLNDKMERINIINKLIKNDKIRKNYYKSLENEIYIIYLCIKSNN